MEKSAETKETKLELKDGDSFYVEEECMVEDTKWTLPVCRFDIIEMVRVAPDSFRSHLIKIIKKAGGNATDPTWMINQNAEPFFISQEDFNNLPLAPERRKGPVSAENPISLERAKQLLQEGETCAMRKEPASESAVRDLMLTARAKVRTEGPKVTLSGEEKEALLSADPPTD